MKMSEVFEFGELFINFPDGRKPSLSDALDFHLAFPQKDSKYAKAIKLAVNTHDQKDLDIHRLLEGLKPFADYCEVYCTAEIDDEQIMLSYSKDNKCVKAKDLRNAHQLRTELIKTYGEKR